MTHMQPVFKPLLKPHLEDLEKKVAPGLFILTWASMNIDGYLHRFKQVGAAQPRWLSMAEQLRYCSWQTAVGHQSQLPASRLSDGTGSQPLMSSSNQLVWHAACGCCLQGLARLEELVRKVMDIVDNRVQANLNLIRGMLLVELPADRCVCCYNGGPGMLCYNGCGAGMVCP